MMKTRVGVLRGGMSSEYDMSLSTGAEVLKHLPDERYEKLDVLIDKRGNWYVRGMKSDPTRVMAQVDVMYPALHGMYGEDGGVQKIMTAHGAKYIGSDAFASSLAMNKALAKERVAQAGIKVPHHKVVHIGDISAQYVDDLFREFPLPWVVKPLDSGSSIGVRIADSYETLMESFEDASEESNRILVEEFISGKEVSCVLLENYRGEDMYVFPEVEIIPKKKFGHFDLDAKLHPGSCEKCPGGFDMHVKKELAEYTRQVHQALGLRHFSQMDFIVTNRGIYFIEANTIPKLLPGSHMSRAVEAVGASMPEILHHCVSLVLRR